MAVNYQTLIVNKTGANQAYTSIQAAINVANDGDTIIIAPGTYEEHLIIQKDIRILGQNRYKCIIQANIDDYDHPVIDMTAGEIGNMQVYGYSNGEIGAKGRAYCLHVDNVLCYQSSVYVHDIDFTNSAMQTIGIGMWPDFFLRFERCNFICQTNLAAFYCHSNFNSNPMTYWGGQNLYVYDCSFANNTTTDSTAESVIRMESYGLCNTANGQMAICEWADNKIIPNPYCNSVKMIEHNTWYSNNTNWLNSNDWVLSPMSMGNNTNALNKWNV